MTTFQSRTETFNPTLPPEGTPDFTGASQGYGADHKWETLFGTAGAVIEGAAKSTDQEIQKRIRTQATQEVDATRALFGADAATTAASGTDLNPGPAGLADARDQLSRIKGAYEAGSIRESHYLGLLNATAKKLRAQYPGYGEQVDNIIQDITGLNPANAVVSALRQEAMSDLEKRDRAAHDRYMYEKEYGPEIETAIPGYFQTPEDQRPSFSEVIAKTNRVRSQHAQVDWQLSDMRMLDEQGQLDYTTRVAKSRDIAATLAHQSYTGAIQTLGKSFDEINQKVQAWQQAGKVPSAEELVALNQQASNVKLQISQNIANALGDDFYKLKDDDRKQILASALAPVDMILDGINNHDYGLVQAGALYVQATKDTEARRIIEGSNIMPTILGAREILGDQEFQKWFEAGGHFADFDQLIGLDALLKRGKPGDEGPTTTLSDIAKKGASGDTIQRVMDFNQSMITGQNPDLAETSIKWMFGSDPTKDSTSGIKIEAFDPKQQADIFQKLVTPAVTDKVKEMSKDNPDLWKNYVTWTMKSFQTIYRQLGADIREIPKEQLNLLTFSFNPETGTIQAIPKPIGFDEFAAAGNARGIDMLNYGTTQLMQADAMDKFSDLNKALSSLKPVFDADGSDYAGPMTQLLQQLGIPMETTRSGSPDERSQNVIENTDGLAQGITSLNGVQLASANDKDLLNMIGTAEGAGYDTFSGGSDQSLTGKTVGEVLQIQKGWSSIPNAIASTAGKYQIKRSTLQALVNQGVLSPDDIFNEKTQDKAAMALLKRRGYDKFKAGQIPAQTFLNNLALEWASVPDASGNSAYAGDGVNNATPGGKALAESLLGG